MTNSKRRYWLGHQTPSSQDTFFIEALDANLWEQGDESQWDAGWLTSMPDRKVFDSLKPHQSINHIPGNNALTIKSNLYQTLVSAKKLLPNQSEAERYQFFPKTYSMPEDYFSFQTDAQSNPNQLWIQKPKNLSRGRGIEMVKHPSMVPLSEEWIIQQYLSNPHLMDGHKYVLRCYVFITSIEPLRVYWYQEGFAKLASERYSENDLDNLYRHLTNPDINEENVGVETPVTFIPFKQYREWLQEQGHDDVQLFDKLKDLITLTVIAAREKMRKRCHDISQNAQGCYELIGLDCMVDANLKPWILECNLSPSLDTYASDGIGASDEISIKRGLVRDMVNMLGLNHSQITARLPLSQQLAIELSNAGQFECLFPSHNVNHYANCFPIPRYADVYSLPKGASINIGQLHLTANENCEHLFADSLAIFSQTNADTQGHFITPNNMATWIWLKNSEGLTPEQIVTELKIAMPKPKKISDDEYQTDLLKQVWDVLADWAQAGVFRKQPEQQQAQNPNWVSAATLTVLNQNIVLRFSCQIAAQHLKQLLIEIVDPQKSDLTIDIITSKDGYTLVSDATLIENGLKLSELLPAIYSFVIHRCVDDNKSLLQMSAIRIANRTLLLSGNSQYLDAITYQLLENNRHYKLLGSTVILDAKSHKVTTTDLPLRLPLDSALTPTKNHLTCVEHNELAYYLAPSSIGKHDIEYVDGIIFINDNHSKDKPVKSIDSPTKADSLMRIWNCIINKNAELNTALHQWIDKQKSVVITGNNTAEAVDEIKGFLEKNQWVKSLESAVSS